MATFENVKVVGMHFRPQGKELTAQLEAQFNQRTFNDGEGTWNGPDLPEITLVPEPENQYDQNALKVMLEDSHLGYVNRDDAVWITPALEDAEEVTVTLVGFEEGVRKNRHPLLNIEID